ncbi:GAJ protein [Penicillium argentinense]|uniref:Meiotic nuclear division protein 1 n=1 Tax=Penicillium argentinense TaxID=1131581 RepID=A0A9W9K3L8_9EURO|nr:GAJ protein [Penicillium argentinense]KAJ5090902.1 GAJ protein [Penicillium argentinense]
MPPKLSKSDKQDRIVTHLRATGTCHTLKDLEKSLPAVASINGIQVKEYLQALTDEGRLRVEKIGSGNWYWIFGSDERIQRAQQLARVKTEVERARSCWTDVVAALAAETTRREQEADDQRRDAERTALQAQRAELQAAVDRLRRTEAQTGLDSVSSKGVLQLREELAGFTQEAMQWTDDIYVLEEYLRRLASGDREVVAAVQRDCYGDEYVEGEGLREL